MPQALSLGKLAHIRAGLELGTDQKTIAQQVGISKRQVTRIKHNIATYGSVHRTKKPGQGRQPLIIEGMADICPYFGLECCWFSLGAPGVFNAKVQCTTWQDGLFHLGYVWCTCLRVLCWPFAQEKEMDAETGTFVLRRGGSLLTCPASTTCSRAKPRAQGRLDTQDMWMARRPVDIPWWIGSKREVCSSQIWMGTNRHHSTHLQPYKALRMLVSPSCLCCRWFHCLADYPGLV